MITIFRKIRQKLLKEHKISRYFLYAVGEIILVVIGILIALQVNNWNIERLEKQQELKYLNNIVIDLEKDLSRLEYLIEFRNTRLLGDQEIIEHANGKTIEDLNEFTFHVVNTLMEEKFTPNNNTYSALSSSGNLNIISNDSIKVLLLELEELYKSNDLLIDHETFDYREYLSKNLVRLTNISQLFPVYSGDKTAAEQNIQKEDFKALLNSSEYINGLYIMTSMSAGYLNLYDLMVSKSRTIIRMIEHELKR